MKLSAAVAAVCPKLQFRTPNDKEGLFLGSIGALLQTNAEPSAHIASSLLRLGQPLIIPKRTTQHFAFSKRNFF
jgi:hypothetical protein